ncbi:MAG: hypothetical protein JXR60_06515, partial [Bacteroidales bacterium]|nr:hypothetical protein [Bacteroidales bacterium]
MKKILNIILFFSLVFGSCTKEKNFQHHEKGFEYMIVEKSEDGKQPKINDILVLDMKYLLNDDSLLFDSKELNNDFRMKRKKGQVNGSSIDDALCLLNLGDSAVFKINAIDFYTFTKRQNAPVGLKQSDEIYFYVRLKNVIDYDHF